MTYKSGGGYAIFSKDDMQLLEYSERGNPYKDVGKDNAYYAGPSEYYEKEETEFKNIKTDRKISIEKAKKIGEKTSEFVNSINILKRIEVKSLDSLQSINKNETTIEKSSESTGKEPVPIDQYRVVSKKYIDNKEYFQVNPYFAYNVYGTCTTVATQLLLGYNNWAKDGRLITNPNFLWGRSGEDISQNLNKPLHKDTISTTDAFYLCLLEEIDPEGYEQTITNNADKQEDMGGATIADAKRGILYYLENYVEETVRNQITVSTDYIFGVYNTIVTETNYNRPVMVGIKSYEEDGSLSTSGHMVVAYGYQTFDVAGENIDGIICHYGWHDDEEKGIIYNEVWVNSSWATCCLTFSTSHAHTDKFITYVNEEGETNEDTHILRCATCNRIAPTNNHAFSTYEKIDVFGERDGDPVKHIAKCYCGYTCEEEHSFYYYSRNNSTHIKKCSKCGHKKEEPHFQKYPGECWICCAKW
ncbi:MAG: hypothetical protein IJW43_01230 [Clostridia bacterium]|nr:hypothetical protein [Clostridia bacterium]